MAAAAATAVAHASALYHNVPRPPAAGEGVQAAGALPPPLTLLPPQLPEGARGKGEAAGGGRGAGAPPRQQAGALGPAAGGGASEAGTGKAAELQRTPSPQQQRRWSVRAALQSHAIKIKVDDWAT